MNKQSSKDNFIMAGILTVQFTVKAPVPGVGVCSLIFIHSLRTGARMTVVKQTPSKEVLSALLCFVVDFEIARRWERSAD